MGCRGKKKKDFLFGFLFCFLAVMLFGCNSVLKSATSSASGKNLNMSGYAMFAEGEFANAETLVPQGKVIIGRVDYKSRKVTIPADTKVPDSGFFKATKTKSLLGVEESIFEYDWTASSVDNGKVAEDKCKELQKKAEQALNPVVVDTVSTDTKQKDVTENTEKAEQVK